MIRQFEAENQELKAENPKRVAKENILLFGIEDRNYQLAKTFAKSLETYYILTFTKKILAIFIFWVRLPTDL